ncbi:MAG TPA: HAMP domain-containing sensor histidine kinase [Acidimicrobiales bacterium]|nr:HAMP domain-containing sensor histidine kinase [Acidimicrobiales bacterium]
MSGELQHVLLPDAVVVVDGLGVVVDVNDLAVDLLGRGRELLIGSEAAVVVPLQSTTGRSAWTRGPVDAAQLHLRTFLLHPPGHEAFPVQAAAIARSTNNGNADGVIVSLRRERQAADAMEVVATVSHELRSPLTAVKGYTSLLLNRWGRLGDDQKRFMLEQVHHDADRVTRLVTELLDISRLETGRLTLHRQRVDLVELARSVVAKVRLEYPDLTCTFEFPDDFPPVLCDPDKIEQVLTNLVENAVKYASPVGLAVRGKVADGHVTVSVGDHGEGIPAEDLPRIFERFFRAGHNKPSGTGLGLWISRGLVEAHGGRLTAESTVGRGSTFRFELPIRPPASS